jgi:hypothetical protein
MMFTSCDERARPDAGQVTITPLRREMKLIDLMEAIEQVY